LYICTDLLIRTAANLKMDGNMLILNNNIPKTWQMAIDVNKLTYLHNLLHFVKEVKLSFEKSSIHSTVQ